jgi:Nuclear protein MDM1
MDNKKVAIDKEKFGFEPEKSSRDNKLANGGPGYDKTWYKEVIELRKKAGQYKVSSKLHTLLCLTPGFTSLNSAVDGAWKSTTICTRNKSISGIRFQCVVH